MSVQHLYQKEVQDPEKRALSTEMVEFVQNVFLHAKEKEQCADFATMDL